MRYIKYWSCMFLMVGALLIILKLIGVDLLDCKIYEIAIFWISIGLYFKVSLFFHKRWIK